MLGENIKALRLAHNLNKVELAAKLGVSKQTVSNWENNNVHPSIDTLLKIANFFEVSANYLLDISINDPELDVRGLTEDEINHLQAVIDDMRKSRNLNDG